MDLIFQPGFDQASLFEYEVLCSCLSSFRHPSKQIFRLIQLSEQLQSLILEGLSTDLTLLTTDVKNECFTIAFNERRVLSVMSNSQNFRNDSSSPHSN